MGTEMADAPASSFGEHLRRLREAAGFTQEELAERAALSRDAIGALETGRRRHPHPTTVRALTSALGLSNDDAAVLRAAASKRIGGTVVPVARLRPAPLPRPATRLVGRHRELSDLRDLVVHDKVRLITLTGPGGVGKTRLALAVAEMLAARFRDGVAFVSLAPLRDPTLVVPAIAAALGLSEAGGRSLEERLVESLSEAELLLVLDNFEQVAEAAPDLAPLLAAAPGVSVLITSRVVLRLSGEQEFPVHPFSLPAAAETADIAEIRAADAVTLFLQRARAVRADFAITDANAVTVAALCARLDGLPLAIELAAARCKLLQPEGLLARLDRRLHLLTGGPRDLPARQQTIRDTIAWSYDLLSPAEQSLFRRLAIFAGGFTLEGAQAMFEDSSPENGAPIVLDLLSSLVDKSLLVSAPSEAGEPRFAMLETIREFGLERLEVAGEDAAARDVHAAYILALAESTWPAFRQQAGLDQLEAERASIRAALGWLCERGEDAALLRLAGATIWLWYIRGPLDEGQAWLERALATEGAAAPDSARARALVGAALLAHYKGDDNRARAWLEASLEQAGQVGDSWLLGSALMLLGIVAEDTGDYNLAESRFNEALPLFQATDDRSNTALTLTHLGVVAWGQGDFERAEVLCTESLALHRQINEGWGVSISLGYLGLIAGERGEYAAAAVFHRESLRLRHAAGVWEDAAGSFADLATLASAVGWAKHAARLFGAAAALREAAGRPVVMFPERVVFERAEARARAVLGEEAFATAEAAGRALSFERAVAESLALADEIARTATC